MTHSIEKFIEFEFDEVFTKLKEYVLSSNYQYQIIKLNLKALFLGDSLTYGFQKNL
jgi:hypothetical protein